MSNIDQDSSIDWARQAYEQLKQKQNQEKEETQKLEREAQEKEKLQKLEKSSITDDDSIPKLGDFDKEFTWSAMIWLHKGKK